MKILLTMTTAFYGPQHEFNYEFATAKELGDFMANYALAVQLGDAIKITVVA